MSTPIEPPSFAEYILFLNADANDYSPDQEQYVVRVLGMSTDAFWALTGISTYPDDNERLVRLVDYALMDLTSWIVTQNDNRDEINSPFSSERIGSYSYSKMQQAKDTQTSGLYWLDLLFRVLNTSSDSYSQSWVSSENVFNPEWQTFEQLEQSAFPALHDPFSMG